MTAAKDVQDTAPFHHEGFSSSDDAHPLLAKGPMTYSRMKYIVFNTLDNPRFTRLAYIINASIMAAIAASSLTTVLQTVEQFQTPDMDPVWVALEIFFTIVFSVEIATRIWSCPNRRAQMEDPITYIDILAISPMYIQLLLGHPVDWLALLRVFRLWKITRIYKESRILFYALGQSWRDLLIPGFFVIMMVMFFSSLLWVMERETFPSIPWAMYFVCVTMSTVGYGDVLCGTPWGYAINMLVIGVGVLFMAMPLGIMGDHIVYALNHKDEIIVVSEFRDFFYKRNHSSNWVKEAFVAMDLDASGEVDLLEFHKMMDNFQVGLTRHQERVLFQSLDKDGDGTINQAEFTHMIFEGDTFHHEEVEELLRAQTPRVANSGLEVGTDLHGSSARGWLDVSLDHEGLPAGHVPSPQTARKPGAGSVSKRTGRVKFHGGGAGSVEGRLQQMDEKMDEKLGDLRDEMKMLAESLATIATQLSGKDINTSKKKKWDVKIINK